MANRKTAGCRHALTWPGDAGLVCGYIERVPMPAPEPTVEPITSLTREEIARDFAAAGQPAFRAGQLLEWVYRKRARSFEAMSNLPAGVRTFLAGPVLFGDHRNGAQTGFARHDAKVSFSADGRSVDRDGPDPGVARVYTARRVIGGRFACPRRSAAPTVASSARAAWTVGSAIFARAKSSSRSCAWRRRRARPSTTSCSWGWVNLLPITTNSCAPSASSTLHGVSVSAPGTSRCPPADLAPQIRQLADQPLQIRLAISLHGATDEVRARIMPVNRKYPLAILMDACRYYHERKKQKLTFEYILIDGVNDTEEQASALARWAAGLEAKVNLIPYNTVEGLEWSRPPVARQEAFQGILRDKGISATLRREKGHDIDAACGQLRRQTMAIPVSPL